MNTVKTALDKKALQIEKNTALLLAKTSDFQLIKQYLSNRLSEDFLNDQQKEKLKRYQYIYNQSVSGKYTEQDIVNQIINFFKVSQTQAYEDVRNTKEIISSTVNISRKWELQLELQAAKAYKIKCLETGNLNALAVFQKNIIALLALLPDDEEEKAELFEGHNIEAVFDPRLLGAPDVDMQEVLKAINEKRGKKIKIDMFEEIDYEEVNNA